MTSFFTFRPVPTQEGDNKPVNKNQTDSFSFEERSSSNPPLILLSGDNARTTTLLYDSLTEQGFRVQLAPTYQDAETLWLRDRPSMVLLEVSGSHAVESAVHLALQLKRHDHQVFVAYLADPVLYSSGLAGDAVFPRTTRHLTTALREHFDGEAGSEQFS